MRVLITGINGFIGRHLVQVGMSSGWQITGIVAPGETYLGPGAGAHSPAPAIDAPAMRRDATPVVCPAIRPCDLAGRGARGTLTAIVTGHDAVINLAGVMFGRNPAHHRRGNVTIVEHLIGACAAATPRPHFIQVSSVAALGPSWLGEPLAESAPCRPICVYGHSKRASEQTALAGQRLGVPVTVARPCSIYGPGDRCFLELFTMARAGRFVRLATRHRRYNLMYVADFVAALVAIVARREGSGPLNLGHPAILTDDDLKAALAQATGHTDGLHETFLGRGAARLLGRAYDVAELLSGHPTLMNSGKIAELAHENWLQDFAKQYDVLQFSPRVDLREGIAHTWDWYRREGWA